jgi:predicted aldo/keto reductase-like oxidoreductase
VVSPQWNVEQRRQMDILEELKQQGLIRAHGVSCHTLDALKVAAEDPWVDVVNARINAFGVKMDDVPEKVVPVLQQIHDAGKGIVGMKLVGEGQFRDDPQKRQESIDYVLNLKTVDAMTVGFEKVEELDDFAGAVRRVKKV